MKKVLTGIAFTVILLWRCANKKRREEYKAPETELVHHTVEPNEKPEFNNWCTHIGVSRLYCKSDK